MKDTSPQGDFLAALVLFATKFYGGHMPATWHELRRLSHKAWRETLRERETANKQ